MALEICMRAFTDGSLIDKLQVPTHKLQVPSHILQVPTHKLQVPCVCAWPVFFSPILISLHFSPPSHLEEESNFVFETFNGKNMLEES